MYRIKKTAASWTAFYLFLFIISVYIGKSILNLNSKIFSPNRKTEAAVQTAQNSSEISDTFSNKDVEDQLAKKTFVKNPPEVEHKTDSQAAVNTQRGIKSTGSVKIASRGSSSFSIKGFWPVKGHVTSGFGPRDGEFHKGIDICAPTGTGIYAVMDGEVESSGWNNAGYGNLIIIKHSGGIKSYCAHCSKLLVSAGQRVTRGQKIGEIGMTGDATAPHCHFEIRISNKPVNPIGYLR